MELDLAVNDSTPPAAGEGADEAPEGAAPEPAAAPEKVRLGPGEEKSDEQLRRELTVLLFAAGEPLSQPRLVELLERPAPARVAAALEGLRAELEGSGQPLVLRRVAGAWRLLTDPEYGHVVNRLRTEPRPERISAAALETLAIIAYRQPVSKAEIEAIRGVQAGPVLRSLVDRGLVRITGRAELPGQPLLYGTTKEFLERFGLSALKDLPRDGELNED
jgi:segregation and condensation protein B